MSLILKVSILILIAIALQAVDTNEFEDKEKKYTLNPFGSEDNYLSQHYVDRINDKENRAHFTVIFHILCFCFSIQFFANIPRTAFMQRYAVSTTSTAQNIARIL